LFKKPDFYSHGCMTTYARDEIFIAAHRAEFIAQAIMDAAHTGVEGDRIVAVLPAKKVYRIRKRAKVLPDEL
jgi:nitrogen regulatory protein P-II 1